MLEQVRGLQEQEPVEGEGHCQEAGLGQQGGMPSLAGQGDRHEKNLGQGEECGAHGAKPEQVGPGRRSLPDGDVWGHRQHQDGRDQEVAQRRRGALQTVGGDQREPGRRQQPDGAGQDGHGRRRGRKGFRRLHSEYEGGGGGEKDQYCAESESGGPWQGGGYVHVMSAFSECVGTAANVFGEDVLQ
ncbi:hypothetical protein DSECCO2_610190 [anaerobic digester metagenome]